jgi:hypothetical protein
MGVVVQKENFDTIDIMKDLEIARVTLNKNKIVPCPDNCEEVKPVDEIQQEEVPLLEWIKNGSEAEHFTLVQSKKKRNKKSQLENSVRDVQVRRSKRTTPSIYRDKGRHENSTSSSQANTQQSTQ